MSNEFDNQITESVYNDKIFNFYQKKKYYIIFFIAIIVLCPILYQTKVSFEKKRNAEDLERYSNINNLPLLNKEETIVQLKKLINSKNDTVAMLSLNQYLEIIKSSKSIPTVEKLTSKNRISKRNRELVNIKKSLLIFDHATEKEMLDLLDIRNEKYFFKKTSLTILYDFYTSRNEKKKAQEIEQIVKNEK